MSARRIFRTPRTVRSTATPSKRAGAAGLVALLLLSAFPLVLLAPTASAASDTWTRGAQMPIPVSGAGSAFVNGFLLVSNGYTISGPMNNLQVYDPQQDMWFFGSPSFYSRWDVGAASVGSSLYVLGGWGSYCPDNICEAIERYDMNTDTWSFAGTMQVPRADLMVASVGGIVYSFGGYGDCDPYHEEWPGWPYEVCDTVEAYDPGTGVSTILPPMPYPVQEAAVATIDGKVYIAGGLRLVNNWTEPTNTVLVFDPASSAWIYAPPLPEPRYSALGGACGGALYVAGGITYEPTARVDRYVPSQDAWTRVEDLPSPVFDLAAGTPGAGNLLLAAGGNTYNGPTGDLNRYDCSSVSLTPDLPQGPLPDLEVVAAREWSTAIAGEPVRFEAIIRNNGYAPVFSFSVRFAVDDTSSPGVAHYNRILLPGQSTTVSSATPWTGPDGPHILRVTADPDDQIEEENEGNNVFITPFDVWTVVPTDLVVADIWPVHTTAGTDTQFHASIYVMSFEPPGPFHVEFRVDGATIGTVEVEARYPGEYIEISSPTWRASSGYHVVSVHVDIHNTVPEGDESNNDAFLDFIVSPGTRCPGQDAGGYVCRDIPYDFVDIGAIGVPTGADYNNPSDGIDLPFTFPFYEDQATRVWVSAEGLLSFLPYPYGTPDYGALPSPAAPNHFIAGYWTDLFAMESQIVHATTVIDGRTAFVVQFTDVAHELNALGEASTSNPLNRLTFQVQLFEDGTIRVHYKDARSDGSGIALAGIENRHGTTGLIYQQGTFDLVEVAVEYAPGAPLPPRVDLTVDAVRPAVEPARAGVPTPFHVALRNLGDVQSGPFTVRVFLDGELFEELQHPGLSGGGATTLRTKAWLPTSSGTHVLQAIVDPYGEVAEWDEDNNARLSSFEVQPDPMPDLLVSDLRPSHPVPAPGSATTFTATVTNAGTGPAGPSVLRFRVDGVVFADVAVGALAAGASMNVTSPQWTATAGTHVLHAFVDIEDEVAELNEFNNYRVTPFASQGTTSALHADLAPTSVALSVADPQQDDAVRFVATVQNLGNSISGSFDVRFLLDDGTLIGDTRVLLLAPGETQSVVSPLWTSLGGDHAVRVLVDVRSEVQESDETNNALVAPFRIRQPDLHVLAASWEPGSPAHGDATTLRAIVENRGDGDARRAFNVSFLVDGTLVGRAPVASLQRGAQVVVEVSWNATGGDRLFQVVVDPEGAIPEMDETDNTHGALLRVRQADVALESFGVWPEPPVHGGYTTVSVMLRNAGDAPSGPFAVRFTVDGALLRTVDVADLQVNETTWLEVPWEAVAGSYLLQAALVIPPEGSDRDEGNNAAALPVRVVAPELRVDGISANPGTLTSGVSTTFSATIRNTGDHTADGFTVRFLRDGIFLADVPVAGLAPGAAITVTSPAWTATTGGHTVTVIADSGGIVVEPNESDNTLAGSWGMGPVGGGCDTPGPDSAGYTCREVPPDFVDIRATGSRLLLSDDQVSGAVTLPFAFPFYGATYSSLYVSSNGFVTFASSGNGCCSGQRLPSGTSPNLLIAGYWEDLHPGVGGTIHHGTATIGGRTAKVVQFTDVPHYGYWDRTATFQIQLFPDGTIRVQLSNVQSDGGTHVTGIENGGGTVGLRYKYGSYSVSGKAVEFTTTPSQPPSSGTVDLAVHALMAAPSTPTVGDATRFDAVVVNGGTDTARDFPVRFTVDGSTLAGEPRVLALVPGGAHTVASPLWTATGGSVAIHTATAVADPANVVPETNEGNNQRSLGFRVNRPDLTVTAAEATPVSPAHGDTTTFRATVANVGDGRAPGFRVRFLVDGATIGEATVTGLAPGASATVESPAWTAKGGDRTISVVADPLDEVPGEILDSNNALAVDLRVRMPDLTVLAVAPEGSPEHGATTRFLATVANVGDADATGLFRVRFLVDGVSIGSVDVAGLAAGATASVLSPPWVAVGGEHEVRAILSTVGEVSEDFETDLARWTVSGDGVTRDCAVGNPGCSLRLHPASGARGSATRDVGVLLLEPTRVSFAFRGSDTRGDTDSALDLYLNDGHRVSLSVTNGVSPNTGISLLSGSVSQVFHNWASSNTWYRVTLTLDPATDTVTAEVRSNAGALLARSPALPIPAGADGIASVGFGAVSWSSFRTAFHYDGLLIEGNMKEWNGTNNALAAPFRVRQADLVVGGIALTPTNPQEGEVVAFNVTVTNLGDAAAAASLVRVTLDGTLALGDLAVPALGPGESATFTSSPWTSTGGAHTVTALADLGGDVEESSETNNRRDMGFSVRQADLAVASLAAFPGSPELGDAVTFQASVENVGAGDAGAFRVRILVDGTPVDEVLVAGLPAGGSVHVVSAVWTATAGDHEVLVVVDPDLVILEVDESNNEARLAVHTRQANIVLDGAPGLTAADPEQGDIVSFRATVANVGDGRAPGFRVRFLVDGATVGEATVTGLAPGASATVESPAWTALGGARTVRVVVDAQDEVIERDEGDNAAELAFRVRQPDLVIGSVASSPESPAHGQTVTFTATLTNVGDGTAPASSVGFLLDGSLSLGTVRGTALGPGESVAVTVSWTATGGNRTVTATADLLAEVAEVDEGANGATLALRVRQADLTLTDIAWTPEDPTKNDAIAFTVVVQNLGDAPAGAFRVRFIGDGSVDLGNAWVTGLAAGATLTVSAEDLWRAGRGTHTIRVIVDHYREVEESNEANNVRERVLTVS